ncbi:hypothetical protein [Limnohabitans sp. T6-5]|uniref:hypothetical protein n=1 Tax=Limnohabitans sp. T6-5 TaxID=1100724 RepID=UPI0013048915|nr:hypothetical protein [Limnohabitans sp. T6-5]
MTNQPQLKLFESVQVRSHWDEVEEKWFLSVVDVGQVLNESARPSKFFPQSYCRK